MKENNDICSAERRTRDLVDLSEIVSNFARKVVGKKAFVEADIISNWGDVVGNNMASFSRPLRIDFKKGERTKGILVVEVVSGAFALELQARSKYLIDRVNTFFGYDAINNIKIIQNITGDFSIDDDIHNQQKMLVTEEEENYIKSLSKDVKNCDLEQALQKLGCAVISSNKK